MNNIPADVKIWWLHDLVREEAKPSTDMDEPNDLYAMTKEELLWALENREVIEPERKRDE